MKYILTPNEMRIADRTAINDYKIPGPILMENAARSSSIFIKDLFSSGKIRYKDIVIICGSGNNGGDGFALARHLFEEFKITLYWIGQKEKMSPETLNNYLITTHLGFPIIHISDESELSNIDFNQKCIIDAMIGVGGSENIKGIALSILQKIRQSDSVNIAIDAPTGLNTETGIANPYCFLADWTITMYAIKTGLLMNDGLSVSGSILIAKLGSPKRIIEDLSQTFVLEKKDITKIIPKRNRRTSKFDYGKVLVIAGSKQFPGAAALAANAAIKTGAGLVYLLTPYLHSSVLPEIISLTLQTTQSGSISIKSYDSIMSIIEKVNVVALGPGLGDDSETIELVQKIILATDEKKSIVIDADGLRLINRKTILRKNIIITPHIGEFSRIINKNRKEIEMDTLNLSRELAKELNCIVLLKDVPSIITDGGINYLNINGNPGMATGGSGDVLTGIISALLALGISPIESAALGAFLHSEAGDYYAYHFSQETLTASKILDSLQYVLKNTNIE